MKEKEVSRGINLTSRDRVFLMTNLAEWMVKKMKLPNGITGFYESKATKPPQLDGILFKQQCYEVASRYRGKVIEIKPPSYPANFYKARVEMLNDEFYILLNKHYPYLAFASVVEFGNIQFIDKPTLCEAFSSSYQVLGTKELHAPFNQDLVTQSELNDSEKKQIQYWKPETIGKIVFNYWD